MNKYYNFYKISLLMLAVFSMGCENTLSTKNGKNQKPSFVKAYATNGVVEGPVNQSVDVTIEFNHAAPNLSVIAVEKNVISGFTTEYVIIAGESGKKDIFDNITVSYFIAEAGAHTLIFYYQIVDDESEFLGRYEFAINN